jgi:hypothetical protein
MPNPSPEAAGITARICLGIAIFGAASLVALLLTSTLVLR